MNWYKKSIHFSGKYYYRIHSKGDIFSVLRSGLWSYSPGEMPGSFVDHPEIERWPDQDQDDPQTYRFYVANSEWDIKDDRFRIRIPAEYIEDKLVRDHLGDYYIDTGESSDLIVSPNQFEIDLGQGQWVRGDKISGISRRVWEKYKKPIGYYGNRFEEKSEEEMDENS